MAQQNIPAQATSKTLRYDNLLGVDYQTNPTEINRKRSPDMVNMISDNGGSPIKRFGFRSLGIKMEKLLSVNGVLYGVYREKDRDLNNVDFYNLVLARLAMVDNRISIIDTVDIDSNNYTLGEVGHVFARGSHVYILCANKWYDYDTLTTKIVSVGIDKASLGDATAIMPDDSIIPTVMTLYKPNGQEMITLPQGVDLTGAVQGVNILTPFRRIEYCVQTDTADEVNFTIPNVMKMASTVKVEILDSATYEWKTLTVSTDYTVTATSPALTAVMPDDPTSTYQPNTISGTISFVSAPYKKVMVDSEPHLRFRNADTVEVPAGRPNVRITYAPLDMTTMLVSGNSAYLGFYREARKALFESAAVEMFEARLFAAYKQHAYYSRADKPFMIDDYFYFDADSDIATFAKTSSGIAVLEGEAGDGTIYIAKGEYSTQYQMQMYSLKASSANANVIAPNVKGALNDEPLIVTENGIMGLSTNYVSEKYTLNRSGKINKKLTKEENLNTAVGIVYKDYLYLAINGKMYILDGRHKSQSQNGDNSYECYFFDDMPTVTDMYVIGGRMYFTDATKTYTWNDDMPAHYQYLDWIEYDSLLQEWVNAKPVQARWSSMIDGDGAPQFYKTLSKKGTVVTIQTPMQTSCLVTLIKDGADSYYIGRFDGSTFALSTAALDAFTKKKLKKYKRLQFVIENKEPEPFGILSIIKTYTLGNYAKR